MANDSTPATRTVPAQELRALSLHIAHETRHHLAAVCDYAECLGWAGAQQPLARDRCARAILAETQRVGRFLGYFMALAGQRDQSPPMALDLEDVLFGACAELADLLALHGSTLETSWLGLRRSVEWPPGLLKQVAVAALDTMVASTAEGAAIRLRVAPNSADSVALALTTSADAVAARLPRLLSYRAMALLLTERGGQVRRLRGREDGMVLLIPVDGRQVVIESEQAAQRAG